mgnify:CR=1 FL=1
METTVLLVDDHPLFRKGIRVLLEGEGDMCIAGEAGDGQAAIDLVRELGAAGRTVLVSSHILPEVECMTHQIILIDRGKVLAEGSVTEIRDKIPEHPTTVALESPDPRALAAFLIGRDHEGEGRLAEARRQFEAALRVENL